MSNLIILYLTCFGIQLPIGFFSLLLTILAAHFWTGSGSFPLVRTLVVTLVLALVFSLPALWGWPTFFSMPLSVSALFYLPLWLCAIWFGYRLDPKEAWTIISIHFPLIVGVSLFIYLPIYASLEREYERKQRLNEQPERRAL